MLAAHGDDLSGEVGRVVAGQEDDDVGHLPGLGAAPEQLAPAQDGQVFVGNPVKSMSEPGAERAIVDCAADLEQQISAIS